MEAGTASKSFCQVVESAFTSSNLLHLDACTHPRSLPHCLHLTLIRRAETSRDSRGGNWCQLRTGEVRKCPSKGFSFFSPFCFRAPSKEMKMCSRLVGAIFLPLLSHQLTFPRGVKLAAVATNSERINLSRIVRMRHFTPDLPSRRNGPNNFL